LLVLLLVVLMVLLLIVLMVLLLIVLMLLLPIVMLQLLLVVFVYGLAASFVCSCQQRPQTTTCAVNWTHSVKDRRRRRTIVIKHGKPFRDWRRGRLLPLPAVWLWVSLSLSHRLCSGLCLELGGGLVLLLLERQLIAEQHVRGLQRKDRGRTAMQSALTDN
jgi:hypothetical protein